MKEKWNIIFNLLFRGIKYVQKVDNAIMIDEKKVFVFRKVLDVTKTEFDLKRGEEFYLEKVRLKMVTDPNFLKIIEVKTSVKSWQASEVRFEAELKVIL